MTGPEGPAGVAGPQGPAGPAGPGPIMLPVTSVLRSDPASYVEVWSDQTFSLRLGCRNNGGSTIKYVQVSSPLDGFAGGFDGTGSTYNVALSSSHQTMFANSSNVVFTAFAVLADNSKSIQLTGRLFHDADGLCTLLGTLIKSY